MPSTNSVPKTTPELFNVIVGNPPYITLSLGKNQAKQDIELMNYYKLQFPNSLEYKGNLFAIFIEQGIKLLEDGGYLSFIVPNTLLLSLSFSKIRKYILDNCEIKSILNMKYEAFEGANTGGTCIFVIKKCENPNQNTTLEYSEIISEQEFKDREVISICQDSFNKDEFFRFSVLENSYKSKITNETIPLGKIVKFYQGIITGNNNKFLTQVKLTEKHQRILRGKDIERYNFIYNNWYVEFEPKELWSNTDETFFKADEKLINRQTGDSLVAAFDNRKFFTLDSTHVQVLINDNFTLKYILAVFNSIILNQIYKESVQEQGKVFSQVKTIALKTLPIPNATIEQQAEIADLVDQIMSLKQDFAKYLDGSFRLLESELSATINRNKKLSQFYTLDFPDFITELEKQKIRPTAAQKRNLLELFDTDKSKLLEIQTKIDAVDSEIESLVRGLYGVEGNI